MIGRALVALALLAALGAAPRVAAAPPPDDPRSAVQALLDNRADAVRRGAVDEFLATVDPQASAQFKASQRRQIEGFSSLPLADYRLEVHLEDSGDLAAAAADGYPGATDRYLPETRQRWSIQGMTQVAQLDRLWLTYVERDGRWYVAGDADVADLGLTTPLGLWDGGPVVVSRSTNVVALSHPGEAARAQALAQLTEQALGRVRWPEPWPGQIIVILPSSPDELSTILRSTLDVEKFVAFVGYDAEREPIYTVSGPRMYVQDGNLGKYSTGFQIETLVHELVHAAAAPYSGPYIPSWVHEGLADWIATGRRTSERRPSGSDGVIPRDDEFSTGTRQSIITAYGESRSAVSYLARRAGMDAPAQFFVTLGSLRAEPGSLTYLTDRALRAATSGLDLATLQSGWAGR